MRRLPLGLTVVAVLALTAADHVAGQDSKSSDSRHGCFRGLPLPECRGFWVYELRGSLPIVHTERELRRQYNDSIDFSGPLVTPIREFDKAAALEVGYAWNLSDRDALGTTLAIEVGARTRYMMRARIRRWVGGDGISFEALPGFFRNAEGYDFPGGSGGLGYTLALRVNVLDQGYLGVRYDVLPVPERSWDFGFEQLFDPGGVQHGLHAVAGLGSVPALWGSAALGLGFAVFAAIFAAQSD